MKLRSEEVPVERAGAYAGRTGCECMTGCEGRTGCESGTGCPSVNSVDC